MNEENKLRGSKSK